MHVFKREKRKSKKNFKICTGCVCMLGWEIAILSGSKSEKVGLRSKIFDRDRTFSDFDPERIAIQRSQSIGMD